MKGNTMQVFTTPEGNKIDSITLELMRSEILINTMERVENETLFKMFDIFMSVKNQQK
jgi:hypothetical protein